MYVEPLNKEILFKHFLYEVTAWITLQFVCSY